MENYHNLIKLNLSELRQIGLEIAGKVLMSIEGPTCSGKTNFISDTVISLRKVGIVAKVIDEAATKILEKDPILCKKLNHYPLESNSWRRSKLELQKKILTRQVKDLEEFAKNSDYQIAIMDRSGASTAYHTLPYVKKEERSTVEKICKWATKMSSGVILLSPLGFLDKNSVRYQNSFEEIKAEQEGIEYYLNRWVIDYLKLASTNKNIRMENGLEYILKTLKGIFLKNHFVQEFPENL